MFTKIFQINVLYEKQTRCYIETKFRQQRRYSPSAAIENGNGNLMGHLLGCGLTSKLNFHSSSWRGICKSLESEKRNTFATTSKRGKDFRGSDPLNPGISWNYFLDLFLYGIYLDFFFLFFFRYSFFPSS